MAKVLTKRVLKATSLLGSSQMLGFGLSMVRNKLLAMWVGQAGIAFMGILNQTLDFMCILTQLNIRTSAVRDLAVMSESEQDDTVYVVRRVGLVLGVLGTLLMIIIAPQVSAWFKLADYTWAFRVVSLSLFFTALMNSEQVVLQVRCRFKEIAWGSLVASIIGLIVTVPCYWFLRQSGIVPSIVAYSLAAWLGAWWFTRNMRLPSTSKLSLVACFKRASGFIKTGFLMSASTILSSFVAICILAEVKRTGGILEVGDYQSVNTLLNRYVVILLTSMTMEFYPRISAAAHRPGHLRLMMTHQSILFIRLLFPGIIAIILFAPWLIRFFYTGDFMSGLGYFVWGSVGLLGRMVSTIISYSFLAQNKGWTFFWSEVVSTIISFAMMMTGYELGGLTGLGIATGLWYIVDMLIISVSAYMSHLPLPRLRCLLLPIVLSAPLALLAYVRLA